jgi:hypothetical protein
VEKDHRGELARLTGIPATNLSAINQGNKPLTPESAQKIMDAVPGVTLLDLGASDEIVADDPLSQLLIERVARLEEAVFGQK